MSCRVLALKYFLVHFSNLKKFALDLLWKRTPLSHPDSGLPKLLVVPELSVPVVPEGLHLAGERHVGRAELGQRHGQLGLGRRGLLVCEKGGKYLYLGKEKKHSFKKLRRIAA